MPAVVLSIPDVWAGVCIGAAVMFLAFVGLAAIILRAMRLRYTVIHPDREGAP